MRDRHHEPIHITVPAGPLDPREPLPPDPPGIVIHRVPALHPDDMDVVDGIPCTSVARTLIDCAQDATREELRAMMLRAIELGLFDLEAIEASLARVEWRPSLEMFREVLAGVVRDVGA
jgi:peptide subunit release factor 1 (eRF1)